MLSWFTPRPLHSSQGGVRPTQTQRQTERQRQSLGAAAQVHPEAAGLDVGATMVYAAVRAERAEARIESFPTFTRDLHALADWLSTCQVTTVAMESTGVYWIPVHQILEARGFEVLLVNARHVCSVARATSRTANGCATCTRPACCAARSDRLTRYVRCAPCCVIATA